MNKRSGLYTFTAIYPSQQSGVLAQIKRITVDLDMLSPEELQLLLQLFEKATRPAAVGTIRS
jgi:hypothetical protein